MLTYQQAQELIWSRARSFGREVIDLTNATGRVLAEPVIADRDYPPFNRSAMDGYALNYTDYEGGIRHYQVAETIYAGQVSQVAISSNQCYRIMTGASVPGSADMVIRREDVIEQDNAITLKIEDARRFQHISLQGDDLKALSTVLPPSSVCTPSVIGLLAAFGKAQVTVEKLPSVGLFTTGNEVVPIDQLVNTVQIHNSNRYLLSALLRKWQVKPQIVQHVADDKEQLKSAFEKAMDLDLILVSGGVSAGDADFVPEVLESLGVKKLFHKLAIKPGKPLWCGERESGRLVFALPGNPFSSLVTYILFVNTFLQASLGLPSFTILNLPINRSRTKKSALDEFFPVRLTRPATMLEPVNFNGSGDIRAGLHADGLAIHPAHSNTLPANTMVDFIPFA